LAASGSVFAVVFFAESIQGNGAASVSGYLSTVSVQKLRASCNCLRRCRYGI